MNRAPIRVAFITHYTALYGANRSLLCLLDGIRDTEIQPIVVLPEGDQGLGEELKQRNIDTIHCDVPLQFVTTKKRPPIYRPIQRRRWTATRTLDIDQRIQNACRVLAKQLTNIDVVYTNTSATALGHSLAKRLSRPHIWHLREFAENYDMHPVVGRDKFRDRLLDADQLIAISHAVAVKLLGKMTAHCHQIYNGVGTEADFDQWKTMREKRKPNSAFRFLLLGQILPSKGHKSAVEAIKSLSNVTPEKAKLRIVGSGDNDWLSSVIQHSGATEQVEIVAPTPDPFQEIVTADALLMCSPMEAMGRVTAEAMVSGCPVIGFDAYGTSELIEHGKTGLLYRTQSQLVDCMQQLMKDPSLGLRLAENAYQSAVKRFSNEKYASQVAAVIRKAAAVQ